METKCVCETQLPPIMANSKDGQGHKVKFLNTSRSRSQGKKMLVPREVLSRGTL